MSTEEKTRTMEQEFEIVDGHFVLPDSKVEVQLRKIGPLVYRRIMRAARKDEDELQYQMVRHGCKSPTWHVPDNPEDANVPEGKKSLDDISMLDFLVLVKAVSVFSGLEEAQERLAPFLKTPTSS